MIIITTNTNTTRLIGIECLRKKRGKGVILLRNESNLTTLITSFIVRCISPNPIQLIRITNKIFKKINPIKTAVSTHIGIEILIVDGNI